MLRRVALLSVRLAAALRPSSPPRSPLSPLVDVLPPKVRAEGPAGLVGYSFVELCWWGAPAAYVAAQGADASLDAAAILEAAKAPFLLALLFWPNSWFRNGASIRIARVLQRRPMP